MGRRRLTSGALVWLTLLVSPAPALRLPALARAGGELRLEVAQGGDYELRLASGAVRKATVAPLPAAQAVAGPWQVSFPAGSGAPMHG